MSKWILKEHNDSDKKPSSPCFSFPKEVFSPPFHPWAFCSFFCSFWIGNVVSVTPVNFDKSVHIFFLISNYHCSYFHWSTVDLWHCASFRCTVKWFSCCGCSVTHSWPTLCDPKDCSTPCLPVPHHLPKFANVHAYYIDDAIQPSHPLMPSSPFALSLSQHRGLFQWVSCSPSDGQNTGASASATVFPMSFQGWFPLRLTGLSSLPSKGLSGVSPAPQFKGISSLALFLLYGVPHTTVRGHWENHSLDYINLGGESNVSAFQYCLGFS